MELLLFLKNNFFVILICILVGYLLGSINASIIVTKKTTNKDIRTLGSGNAGFTNVLRCIGVKEAIITIIIDFLKAIIATEVAAFIFSSLGTGDYLSDYGKIFSGVFCVIGHMYPLYFGFRGGKGVVTSAAMMCILDFRIFLLAVAVFLIVFLFSKIVSLSSISGAFAYPLITFIIKFFVDFKAFEGPFNASELIITLFYISSSIFLAFLVIIRHKSNIKRLIKGEEKKVSIFTKK